MAPPNPNEFDSTRPSPQRAGRGHAPRRWRRPGRGAPGRRSAGPVRRRSDQSATIASTAPEPPIMWPVVALDRGDRRRRAVEQGDQRRRLGGVVEHRRGAVGVDVADPAGRDAGVVEREAHAPRAHPRRRGSARRGGGRRRSCRSPRRARARIARLPTASSSRSSTTKPAPSAKHEAVTVDVERPRGVGRVVGVAGSSRRAGGTSRPRCR